MPERTVSILAILRDKLSPGLSNISKNFQGLRTTVGTLGKQFSFLTSTAARFIGAFAGIQGIRRALDLAEKQVEATTQLAFALEGLPDIYADINKQANEFQRNTTVGNEEFQRQAAILKASGVAAEDLAEATKAVFQAATALGRPVESIRSQLVAITATGTARGELKGALSGITKEALLQGAAFKVLGERYAGAAEKLAETPFGRAKQEANKLGDTLEEIGKTLITLKVVILEAANDAVAKLLELFQSSTWKVYSAILSEVISFAINMLPTILSLVVAYKAWRLAVWAVVTAKLALLAVWKALLVVGALFAPLLAPWILLPVLVGVALVAVRSFFGVFSGTSKAFEDAGKKSAVLWDGIASGAIGVSDALAVVKNTFITLFLEIGVGFFDPVESAFRKLWAIIVGGWQRIKSTTSLIFFGMAKVIGDAFFNLVTFIAEKLDNLTGTNLAKATRGGFTALDSQLEDSKRAAIDAVFETRDALDKIDADMVKSAKTAASAIAMLAAETEAILDKARAGAGAGAGGDTIPGVSSDQLQREIELAAQIAAVRTGTNKEALDIISAQEAEALDRDLKLGRIGESEFAAERLRIAKETADAEADIVREQIAALAELAQSRFESGQASGDVLQKQLVLEQELQAMLGEQAKGVRAISDEINVLSAALSGKAAIAQGELNAELQKTAELVEKGTVTYEEAAARNAAAANVFREALTDIEVELLALQTQGGDTEAFELAAEKIKVIWGKTADAIGNASDALARRSRSTWTEFGAAFRQQLVAPLTELMDGLGASLVGVVDGAKDANDAFRDFGKQAIQVLLKLIQQWLIAKVLGLPTFGSRAGANAGGLVHGSGLVFAGGGHVPGPASVHRDTVPAMLTPGEFVVRESASSYYGAGIMRAMNRMLFPRELFGNVPGGASRYALGGFQAGGEIAAGSTRDGAEPREAVVVANEAAFARLLTGGSGAMLRFFEAHRNEIGGILGSRR